MKEKEIKQLLKSNSSLIFEDDFNVQIVEEEFKCGGAGRVDFILQINNETYITEVKGETSLKDAIGKVITYSDQIDKRYEGCKKLILAYKIPKFIKTTCKKMHIYFYEIFSRETNIIINSCKDLLSDISIQSQHSFLLMLEYLECLAGDKNYKDWNLNIPKPSRYRIITPSNQSTVNLRPEEFSFYYLYFEDPHLLKPQWREYIYDMIRRDNDNGDFRMRVVEYNKSPSYITKNFWKDDFFDPSEHNIKGGFMKPFFIVMCNTASGLCIQFRLDPCPLAKSTIQTLEYFLRNPRKVGNLKKSLTEKNKEFNKKIGDIYSSQNRKLIVCSQIIYNALCMYHFIIPNYQNVRILEDATKSVLINEYDKEIIEKSVKMGFGVYLNQLQDEGISILYSVDL